MSENNVNNEVSKILNQYKELHKISGADVDSLTDEDVASIFGQDLKDKKLDGMTVNDDGQPVKLLNGFSEEVDQKKLDDITTAYSQLAAANDKEVPVQQDKTENKVNENNSANNGLISLDEMYANDSTFSNLVKEHDVMREELDKLEVQFGFTGEKADEATRAKMGELNGKIAANIAAQEARRQELWKAAGITDNTITKDDDNSVARAKYNAQQASLNQQSDKQNVETSQDRSENINDNKSTQPEKDEEGPENVSRRKRHGRHGRHSRSHSKLGSILLTILTPLAFLGSLFGLFKKD